VIKFLKSILLTLSLGLSASAQQQTQPDSIVYLMNSDTEQSATKEEAKFLRLIVKADSGMFNVQDYDMNDVRRLIARTTVGDWDYTKGAQGIVYQYFETGKRQSIKNYKDGKLKGDGMFFYPNGGLYKTEHYKGDSIFLKTCYDTSGNILAKEGNGKWIDINMNYAPFAEGPVVNGKRDGIWTEYESNINHCYENGKSAKLDPQASFPGGDKMFAQYLSKAIRYTDAARQKNVQGRIILTFVIDKNGRPSNVKIVRGIEATLDRVAINTIQNMPAWTPGIFRGQPVSVQYSVPVDFSTTKQNSNPDRMMDSNFDKQGF
jgi:TonB family protein